MATKKRNVPHKKRKLAMKKRAVKKKVVKNARKVAKKAIAKRGRPAAKKRRVVKATKQKSSSSLRVAAINRTAEAHVICDLLMEHQINHLDLSVDKDFVMLHMLPQDAVGFYALFLKECSRPFKEELVFHYKTGMSDLVVVNIPIALMSEITKILTKALEKAA